MEPHDPLGFPFEWDHFAGMIRRYFSSYITIFQRDLHQYFPPELDFSARDDPIQYTIAIESDLP